MGRAIAGYAWISAKRMRSYVQHLRFRRTRNHPDACSIGPTMVRCRRPPFRGSGCFASPMAKRCVSSPSPSDQEIRTKRRRESPTRNIKRGTVHANANGILHARSFTVLLGCEGQPGLKHSEASRGVRCRFGSMGNRSKIAAIVFHCHSTPRGTGPRERSLPSSDERAVTPNRLRPRSRCPANHASSFAHDRSRENRLERPWFTDAASVVRCHDARVDSADGRVAFRRCNTC